MIYWDVVSSINLLEELFDDIYFFAIIFSFKSELFLNISLLLLF